jgi:glycosyltransferase involved in cell wall biosynthesis
MTTESSLTHSSLPQVSVVVPTKNRPQFVRRAVLSALNQVGVSVEVVVVDDGGDTSLDLPELHDPRVKIIRHGISRGVAAARNRGIRETLSPWIAFLDDDDFWGPEKLARQVAAATAANAGWCVTGAVVVSESCVPISRRTAPTKPGPLLDGLCTHNSVPGGGSGVLVARRVLEEVGGFDETLSMVADWEMWHRLAHSAPCAIADGVNVGYTQHKMSMTSTFHNHADEVGRLETVTRTYCGASTKLRNAVYLDWVANNMYAYDRRAAARAKASVALRGRSISGLTMAARMALVPSDFSFKRALGLAWSTPAPVEQPDWLAADSYAVDERVPSP